MGAITASRSTLRPDPKYKSVLASKFINCLMYCGKKGVAQGVFYEALDHIKKMDEKYKAPGKKTAYENILWALVNTKEFWFNQ